MAELKFNLNVADSALLNANPVEFFSKAYITEDIVDNYRTLPGIKSKTKIATTDFGNILKISTADFSTTTGAETLRAVEVDVQPVSAMAELNRFQLEQSYLSLSMAKGSGASYEVQPFMNFYWDQMAQEIQQEVELIRWRGNLGSTASGYTGSNAFLALADGYEKQLAADSAVNKVTASASITVSNVIAEMTKVYSSLVTNAPQLVNRTEDLRFYVSANVAACYKQAVAQANVLSYITKQLDLTFLDIKVVVAQGLSTNKMCLTLKTNLIYAFDGEGDGKALKAINLEESVAEPKLRTRANLKIGFYHVNPVEIVYYA